MMKQNFKKVLFLGVYLPLSSLNASDNNQPNAENTAGVQDAVLAVPAEAVVAVIDPAEAEHLRREAAIAQMYRERAARFEAQRRQQPQQVEALVPVNRRLDDEAEQRYQAEMAEAERARVEAERAVAAEREEEQRAEVERRDRDAVRDNIITFFTRPFFSGTSWHIDTLNRIHTYYTEHNIEQPFQQWLVNMVNEGQQLPVLERLVEEFDRVNHTELDFYGFILFNQIFNLERDGEAFNFEVDFNAFEAFINHLRTINSALAGIDRAFELLTEIALFTENDYLARQLTNWQGFRAWVLRNIGLFQETEVFAAIADPVAFLRFVNAQAEIYQDWLERTPPGGEDHNAGVAVHGAYGGGATAAAGGGGGAAAANGGDVSEFDGLVAQLMRSLGCSREVAEGLVREGVQFRTGGNHNHVPQHAAAAYGGGGAVAGRNAAAIDVVPMIEDRVQALMLSGFDEETARAIARAEL